MKKILILIISLFLISGLLAVHEVSEPISGAGNTPFIIIPDGQLEAGNITCVEVMNEPANGNALATKENFNDLVNFVGENIYLMKDALGPEMPVSVGFRSWHEDLSFWSSIAEGVDILMPHYWESLESYNIDTPGLWPLDTPVEKL